MILSLRESEMNKEHVTHYVHGQGMISNENEERIYPYNIYEERGGTIKISWSFKTSSDPSTS